MALAHEEPKAAVAPTARADDKGAGEATAVARGRGAGGRVLRVRTTAASALVRFRRPGAAPNDQDPLFREASKAIFIYLF